MNPQETSVSQFDSASPHLKNSPLVGKPIMTPEQENTMPGPDFNSYLDSPDPEWGTRANSDAIGRELLRLHQRIGIVLGRHMEPNDKPILEVAHGDDGVLDIPETLTERDWRFLRFACERALKSL